VCPFPEIKNPADVSASTGQKNGKGICDFEGSFRPALSGFEILKVNIRLNVI